MGGGGRGKPRVLHKQKPTGEVDTASNMNTRCLLLIAMMMDTRGVGCGHGLDKGGRPLLKTEIFMMHLKTLSPCKEKEDTSN